MHIIGLFHPREEPWPKVIPLFTDYLVVLDSQAIASICGNLKTSKLCVIDTPQAIRHIIQTLSFTSI